MSQYNDTSTLDGFFKEVFAEKVQKLVPENDLILRAVAFEAKERTGKHYSQPVVLSREAGATYSSSGGVLTLNDAIASTMKDAQVSGGQIYFRSQISYDAASKSQSSKAAFASVNELTVENLVESVSNRLEMSCLYGQSGLAKTSSSANADTTHTVVTITDATWADGIFSGAEGSQINFYNGSSLVSSGADAIFTIDAVDFDNRKLTLSGTATGIAALDTSIAAGTRDIYWRGAYGNEAAGFDKIITNTGTLFGIDASDYALWKGSSYNASGAISFAKLTQAVARGVARGLNEKATVMLSPKAWNVLNADQAALTRHNSSGSKKLENGAEALTFYSSNGEIEVVSHPMVKNGEGFIVPMKRVKRIGSTDVTCELPGRKDQFFLHMPDKTGYELRCMSDQAVFIETPARCVKITGITYS
jgi:hypothetical protein